jgi:6-phosphogluconolactonase (cycloisomerase 2 family)
MSHNRLVSRVAAAALAITGLAAFATPAIADGGASVATRQVFQATNDPAGNAIQVFEQAADGAFVAGPVVATGGKGLGGSLASQGAVTRIGRHLLVVNAGDDTVSSFILSRRGLELRDVESSGGVRPVSVTANEGGTVYVLNAGDDTISGLRVDGDGDLTPIADSTLPLSTTNTGAAQVQFNHAGNALVVTEKATRSIDVYRIGAEGRASGPEVIASVGVVPYGFDIDRGDHVVVSEAATGSVSSYQLDRDSLDVISGGVPDTQGAPCWLEISADGRYAWTTNAASNSISSYAVGRDGSLTLLAAVAATTPAGPTDIAQSLDGTYLFVRVRSGAVATYGINDDGSLTDLGTIAGARSVGTSGLAAV